MTLPPPGPQAAIGYGGPPTAHGDQPHSDYQPSYIHQLSDLRTGSATSNKRKRAGSSSALSTSPSIQSDNEAAVNVNPNGVGPCFLDGLIQCHAGASPPDVCADCVLDCDDVNCQAASTDKCTDQCVVIPCNDQSTCPSACNEEHCRIENCDGGDQCFGALNDSLQLLCCTDYHDCSTSPATINWNCSLDEFLGMNSPSYGFSANPHLLNAPFNSTSGNSTHDFSGMSPSLPFQGKNAGNALPGSLQPTTPVAPAPQPLLQPTNSNDFVCRWSGCNLQFGSLNELVGHVNLTHLRPPTSSSPRLSKKPRLDNSTQDTLPLSCHWDDCHLYPNASMLPGPSTGLQPEMAFDLLSNHFFQDHLGLAVPPAHTLPVFHAPNEAATRSLTDSNNAEQPVEANPLPTTTQTQADKENPQKVQSANPTYATPEPSPPPDTTPPLSSSSSAASPPHDCSTSTHTCHWKSCGESFPTCAALTEHLALAHVGSGKGHYDCHWADCQRSGKQGFSSKQKIMRHLQAHTGHRPFLCKECGQHFSEAATLAQHMRRHTQEKPFVCDFPGCGKAFAITGALTIHKRTHNGERPFRCPHCDRAFAESSNLSKHLRTHTGDRPYRCLEPGCGKAFARPDQLQRHGNVHTKKRAMGPTAGNAGDEAPPVASEAIAVK